MTSLMLVVFCRVRGRCMKAGTMYSSAMPFIPPLDDNNWPIH